jgi:hypothetical protein
MEKSPNVSELINIVYLNGGIFQYIQAGENSVINAVQSGNQVETIIKEKLVNYINNGQVGVMGENSQLLGEATFTQNYF